MENILKYPRTRHIEGSRLQKGDEDLKSVPFHDIKDHYVVLEEKVDGANSGISFDQDGKMFLQSRGHYLNGGYGEKQFDLLKLWANTFQHQLFELLDTRYIMYGEWLYAKHTVFYDELTHYFMEFDIYDNDRKIFLSTKERRALLKESAFITSVPVLYEGKLKSLEEMLSLLGKSQFKSKRCQMVLEELCGDLELSYELARQQSDGTELMEGIYIKVESELEVLERLKYVRASFLSAILDSETHWANRPIIPNRLKKGIDIFDMGSGV